MLLESKLLPGLIRSWREYFLLTRLHKFPLGSILVFWPCAWGLTMGAYKSSLHPWTLFIHTLLFAMGSTLVHSAACVINDICDKDFDKQVERTKNRPLAAGTVSVPGAWTLLIFLLVGCFSMLSFTSYKAVIYGLIGIFPLHGLYPLMKRWTWWPQAWLGLAMNWGYHVAYITLTRRSDIKVNWLFFMGTVCWTIFYDTIYACQDRKDDIKAGVKSTALLFGTFVRPILALFASLFVILVAVAGYLNGQGPAFFVLSCVGAGLHLAWQLLTWDVENPADCGEKFKANGTLGYIVWGGMLVDYGLKIGIIPHMSGGL